MNIRARSLQTLLAPLLFPVSKVWAALMRARRSAYKQGKLSCQVPAIPCISVGNISWGGSGKTPLVSWFAHWAVQNNLSPVILSRGYKGKAKHYPHHVQINDSPAVTGDEPLMLLQQNPQAHVVVDPVRVRSAAWAASHLKASLFLLDDGMQHLRLGRHYDFIVLRPADLLNDWNRVIPVGTWREDSSALETADAFFIRSTPEIFLGLHRIIEQRLAKYGKPVFGFTLQPKTLVPLTKAAEQAQFSSAKTGEKYTLLSAVGTPQDVAYTAWNYLGYAPAAVRTFPDHYSYNAKDIQKLQKIQMPIICTEKDAIKLRPLLVESDIRIWYLAVAAQFTSFSLSDLPFEQWWPVKWAELTGMTAKATLEQLNIENV